MSKLKYTVEDMKRLAGSRGLEFLSSKYINAHTNHTWKCLTCNYIWDTAPSNIQQGRSCHECGKKKQYQSLILDIDDIRKSSLEKGVKFLPEKYRGAIIKHAWQCCKCLYIWLDTFSNIMHKSKGIGRVCPRCCGRHKTLEDLQLFASKKNLTLLSPCFNGNDEKLLYRCNKCVHEWLATPRNIEHHSGCPKCAGQCKTEQDMYQLAEMNGIIFLSKAYKGMRVGHRWKCHSGHEWTTTPSHIQNGTKCPQCCGGINEAKCRFVIESMTGQKFPSDWKVLGNGMQLDGYCESLNIAFEYNGKQHYNMMFFFHKDVSHFQSQQLRDRIKDDICKSKNIYKIDIPYFRAQTNDELEAFIGKYLKTLDIAIYSVNWNKFSGKIIHLEELKSVIASRDIKCLSNTYIHAKHKLSFQCTICNCEWEATPCNIKRGKGCPKCGYIKRVKSRRETLRKRKLEECSILP